MGLIGYGIGCIRSDSVWCFGWGTGLTPIRIDGADSGTGNGKGEMQGSFAALIMT